MYVIIYYYTSYRTQTRAQCNRMREKSSFPERYAIQYDIDVRVKS